MAVQLEVFKQGQNTPVGSYQFEVPPRVGERFVIQGQGEATIVGIRHYVANTPQGHNSPVQFQVLID